MYNKDNQTFTLYQLQQSNPNCSFPATGPDPAWLAENGYAVYQPPAPPAPDPVEQAVAEKLATIKSLTDAVQAFMDTKAKERNYDDIVSACSYAAAPNVFQAESQAYLTWRAACWQKCYQAMAEVEAGTKTLPVPSMEPDAVTPQQWLIDQMPALVLP